MGNYALYFDIDAAAQRRGHWNGLFCFAEITAAMSAHLGSRAVQVGACRALCSMTNSIAHSIALMGYLERSMREDAVLAVVRALVRAMHTYTNHADVQNWAISTLDQIYGQQSGAELLLQRDCLGTCLEAVVIAMNVHATNARVQSISCQFLGKANDASDGNYMVAGGIEAVVAALRTHSSNDCVQEHACCALWYLTESVEDKIKAASAGAIEPLVAAFRSQCYEVKQYACWALQSLSDRDFDDTCPKDISYIQARVVIAGALEIAVADLREGDCDDLRTYCCDLLAALTKTKVGCGAHAVEARIRAGSAGAVEALVAFAVDNSDGSALHALENIIKDNLDNHKRAISAGALQVAEAAAEKSPGKRESLKALLDSLRCGRTIRSCRRRRSGTLRS